MNNQLVERENTLMGGLREMFEILDLQGSRVSKHTNEIKNLDDRMKSVEVKMEKAIKISHREATALVFAKRQRVYEILKAKGESEYKRLRGRHYAALHTSLWENFGVTSYHDIPAFQFELALDFIKNWIPIREIS